MAAKRAAYRPSISDEGNEKLRQMAEATGKEPLQIIEELIAQAANGIEVTPIIKDEPTEFFINTKKEYKQDIAELFGLPSEEIKVTRKELYQKASELSGIDVADIVQSGADYMAQKLISSKGVELKTKAKVKEGVITGQGSLGSADSKLDEQFIIKVEEWIAGNYTPRNGLPLSELCKAHSTFLGTAKKWAERRGMLDDFEGTMPLDIAKKHLEKIKKIVKS